MALAFMREDYAAASSWDSEKGTVLLETFQALAVCVGSLFLELGGYGLNWLVHELAVAGLEARGVLDVCEES